MLPELKKMQDLFKAFERKYWMCSDYPDDVALEIEEKVEEAIHHVQYFDWEQYKIDVNHKEE